MTGDGWIDWWTDKAMKPTAPIWLCGCGLLAVVAIMVILHLLSEQGAHPFAFIIPSLGCGWCFGVAAGRHVEGAR